MNKRTFFLIFGSVLMFNGRAEAFQFFQECLAVDETFYHQIIDADILEVGNSQNWAMVIVNCPGKTASAMSRCATCPDLPNSAVVIQKGKGKLCGGDTVYVVRKPCTIGKIKKEKWTGE